MVWPIMTLGGVQRDSSFTRKPSQRRLPGAKRKPLWRRHRGLDGVQACKNYRKQRIHACFLRTSPVCERPSESARAFCSTEVSVERHAAIHVDRLTGHCAGLLRAKEKRSTRNLLRGLRASLQQAIQ